MTKVSICKSSNVTAHVNVCFCFFFLSVKGNGLKGLYELKGLFTSKYSCKLNRDWEGQIDSNTNMTTKPFCCKLHLARSISYSIRFSFPARGPLKWSSACRPDTRMCSMCCHSPARGGKSSRRRRNSKGTRQWQHRSINQSGPTRLPWRTQDLKKKVKDKQNWFVDDNIQPGTTNHPFWKYKNSHSYELE